MLLLASKFWAQKISWLNYAVDSYHQILVIFFPPIKVFIWQLVYWSKYLRFDSRLPIAIPFSSYRPRTMGSSWNRVEGSFHAQTTRAQSEREDVSVHDWNTNPIHRSKISSRTGFEDISTCSWVSSNKPLGVAMGLDNMKYVNFLSEIFHSPLIM